MATDAVEPTEPGDAELIAAVRRGDVNRFGLLYSRHTAAAANLARQFVRAADVDDLVAEAFARVLDALRAGRGPDEAFRGYLLTTVRHVAYDRTRKDRRLTFSDRTADYDQAVEFRDTAVDGLERSIAATAFRRLPERWQAVLWHSEIEAQSPTDMAPLFGTTPSGMTSLVARAREGLRQAYLQAHIQQAGSPECRLAASQLGSWTRQKLPVRHRAKVTAHLDRCARCQTVAAELTSINTTMRASVAPLVLGGGLAGYLALRPATPVLTALGTQPVAAGPAAPGLTTKMLAGGSAIAAAVVIGLLTVHFGSATAAPATVQAAVSPRSTDRAPIIRSTQPRPVDPADPVSAAPLVRPVRAGSVPPVPRRAPTRPGSRHHHIKVARTTRPAPPSPTVPTVTAPTTTPPIESPPPPIPTVPPTTTPPPTSGVPCPPGGAPKRHHHHCPARADSEPDQP